jgi:hypothetical protein
MLTARCIQCPYCGEPFEVLLEPDDDGQDYIEDCPVCCRPVELRRRVAGGTARLEVHRDDD